MKFWVYIIDNQISDAVIFLKILKPEIALKRIGIKEIYTISGTMFGHKHKQNKHLQEIVI